jgi:elongation factor Tu
MRIISVLSRLGILPLFVFVLLFCFTRDVSAQVNGEEAQKSLPVVSVATLGHQDHGKSTLTAAIVRILSDSERADFVSIDEISNPSEINVQGVQFAGIQVEYESDLAHYIHVDCRPGSDCVKLLSSRRKIFDGAILVVSAPDGPMPQTREQIELARKSGVKWVIVYLNNVDLVRDPELLQLVEKEIRELLTVYGFKGDTVPIIHGNATGRESIIKLLGAMDERSVK